MARATRSSTTNEKDKPTDHPQVSRKGASKKRKRNSNAENEDSLPSKHIRIEPKEGTPDPDDHPEERQYNQLSSSGNVPIQSVDAASILDVLEMVDTQGLLDRVFPLPAVPAEETSPASSSISSSMLSLRSVLKSPTQYPLSVLRAAVKHLLPISSHPRFRPSETAAQQLRFCNLASSLLDQVSRNVAPVPLNSDTVIAENEVQKDATTSQDTPAGVRPRKYALMQRLPTGEWWTSASSGVSMADGDGKDPRTLHTSKAELVSVLPSTSGAQLARKGTLGDYAPKIMPGTTPYKLPPPRRVSCGKFLDYGPYASFAPSFDQDGVEVGRVGMGEVIFHQEMRRRLRSAVKGKRRAFLSSAERIEEDVVMEDVVTGVDTSVNPQSDVDAMEGLASLLSPEEVSGIKRALGTLEMEQAVDELLKRNAKALERLGELQLERLRAQGCSSGAVEIGSEEWNVAQGILDSLGLLASLRPRPSNGSSELAPIIPSSSVLHKLQRTLPLAATEGWYGTLPEGRTTAFRDDTTAHVRAGAASTSKIVPPPATPASKATTPAPAYVAPYAGNYQAYQASQYRGGYGTYTPSQGSSSYYPNSTYNAGTPQQQATAHYPSSQYGNQYYASWFANSGRSTPQLNSTQPSLSGNYSSYFTGTAVANTVQSSTLKQPTAWNGATTAATILPPHMRSTLAGTGAPGTPTAAGTYNGYHGSYTAPR